MWRNTACAKGKNLNKLHVIVGAGFWLMATASAWAVQDCELGGQHIDTSNGQTTAGKTGLIRCKDRDSGLVVREQELQNGKFMGVFRRFDKGRLSQEYGINEAGNRHGREREFAPETGQLLSDKVYDNGSVTGLSRQFHQNGQLRRAAFNAPKSNDEQASAEFNDRGQLENLRCASQSQLAPAADDARWCGFSGGASQIELFNGSGRLAGRSSYLNGQRLRHETFFADGQPQYQSEIVGGLRSERFYVAGGKKRRELQSAAEGKGFVRVREQTFADSGQLARDQRWANGWLASDETFFLNGQPREKTEYGGVDSAVPNSRPIWQQRTSFHDNGQASSRGRYRIGPRGPVDSYASEPMGIHQVFSETGRLIAESTYDDSGRIAREKSWDANGSLLRDEAVFADGSRK
jgi:antitoxin component YwqK of YwqJK toxin-antitoxin module